VSKFSAELGTVVFYLALTTSSFSVFSKRWVFQFRRASQTAA